MAQRNTPDQYLTAGIVSTRYIPFPLRYRLLKTLSKNVKRENSTFWLFQNYVKSDLMSNNMKMSDGMCN